MYTETTLIKQLRQFALIARRYRKTYAPGALEMVKTRWAALVESGLPREGLSVQRERLAALTVREYTSWDVEQKPTYDEVIEALELPEEPA